MTLLKTQALIVILSLTSCFGLGSCEFALNQAVAPVDQAPEGSAIPSQPVNYTDAEKAAIAQLAAAISGQFTAYIRQEEFVRDLQQLPVSGTDPNYDFQIATVTDQIAHMTAIAKQPGLRSLSGQVFVLPKSAQAKAYRNSALSGSVCITIDPSNTPPIAPKMATTAEPDCPAGSAQVSVYYPAE